MYPSLIWLKMINTKLNVAAQKWGEGYVEGKPPAFKGLTQELNVFSVYISLAKTLAKFPGHACLQRGKTLYLSIII